jgi:hypothetical protein
MTMKLVLGALALALTTAAATGLEARGRDGMFGMGRMEMGAGPMDFDTLDADKDGSVTQAEIDAFRASQTDGLDADKNGLISAEELRAHIVSRAEASAADMAARMMEMRDANGDGQLGVEELAMGPGPERMFEHVDANADGAVTREEFDAARDAMGQRMRDRRGHRRGHGN